MGTTEGLAMLAREYDRVAREADVVARLLDRHALASVIAARAAKGKPPLDREDVADVVWHALWGGDVVAGEYVRRAAEGAEPAAGRAEPC